MNYKTFIVDIYIYIYFYVDGDAVVLIIRMANWAVPST